MTRVGALLWILAAVAYVAAEGVAAAAIPTYDYATDYISTLGDPARSLRAPVLNAAIFVQAVCFPVGAWLLSRSHRSRKALLFLAFAMMNGMGNLVVASVHSGHGSVWHAVGAALAIGAGNAAIIAGTCSLGLTGVHRITSLALGTAGLLALVAVGFELAPVGIWERGSVYSIYLWQALTAALLIRRSSG